MILDSIENLGEYISLNPKLANGLKKLNEVETEYHKKFYFDGGYLFFQEGMTTHIDEGTFEAHIKYIDVQIVLSGSEYVAWAPINELAIDIEYDTEKDVVRLNGNPKAVMKIDKGMSYIFQPQDGHKAVKHINEAMTFSKAVIKVEI